MKRAKQVLSILLALLMVVLSVPVAFAADEAPTSGQCGESVSWSFDTDTGTLTLSGEGTMRDFDSPYGSSWEAFTELIETVVIGSGITNVGAYAFYYCENLSNVIWNDEITSIGRSAFLRCNLQNQLMIPNSVEYIGAYAFNGCVGLTELVFPESVKEIDEFAFSECSGLSSISFSNGLTKIGDNAFYRCTGLSEITIPDSVTELGSSAFYECTGLTTVSIPKNVQTIGNYPFAECYNLTAIQVDRQNDSFTSRNGVLFNHALTTLIEYPAGKKNAKYSIPNGVLTIARGAFAFNDFLSEITIPESVASINAIAFSYCSALSKIVFKCSDCLIDSNQAEISQQAVFYCYEGSTAEAFAQEKGIQIVLMEKDADPNAPNENELALSGQCGENAFWTLDPKTRTLTVSGTGDMYGVDGLVADHEGYLADASIMGKIEGIIGSELLLKVLRDAGYNYDTKEEAQAAYGTEWTSDEVFTDEAIANIYKELALRMPTSLVVEEGITGIGEGSFCEYKMDFAYLTSVSLPSTLTIICDSAFMGCRKLKHVCIPSKAAIDIYAFEACTSLESVEFSEGVKTIGAYAFANCYALKEVHFPSSMKAIGSVAFGECKQLETVEMLYGVEYIGDGAFNGCKALKNLTVPASVTYIGRNAFGDLPSIENLYLLSENISAFGDFAFRLPVTTRPDWARNHLTSATEWNLLKNISTLFGISYAYEEIEYYIQHKAEALAQLTQGASITEQEFEIQLISFLYYYTVPEIQNAGLEAYIDLDRLETLSAKAGQPELTIAEIETLILEMLSVIGDGMLEYYNSVLNTDFTTMEELCVLVEDDSSPLGIGGVEPSNELKTAIMNHFKLTAEELEASDFGSTTITLDGIKDETVEGDYDLLPFTKLYIQCNSETRSIVESEGLTYILVHEWQADGTCARCGEKKAEDPTPDTPCAHTTTLQNKVDAACTTDGYTGDEVCTVCGETITKGKSIPALGHTDENNDGHCDRCGEKMTGGDHCPDCGKVHNGSFFDKLTGFFHKIIYRLTHLFSR